MAGGTVIGCGIAARREISRARLGVARTLGALSGVFVDEAAAFDEPYNIRLHPTHSAHSRAPRVPALWCIVAPRGAGEPNR